MHPACARERGSGLEAAGGICDRPDQACRSHLQPAARQRPGPPRAPPAHNAEAWAPTFDDVHFIRAQLTAKRLPLLVDVHQSLELGTPVGGAAGSTRHPSVAHAADSWQLGNSTSTVPVRHQQLAWSVQSSADAASGGSGPQQLPAA